MPAGGDGELMGRSYTGFRVQADQVRRTTDDSPTSEMSGVREVRLKLQPPPIKKAVITETKTPRIPQLL